MTPETETNPTCVGQPGLPDWTCRCGFRAGSPQAYQAHRGIEPDYSDQEEP